MDAHTDSLAWWSGIGDPHGALDLFADEDAFAAWDGLSEIAQTDLTCWERFDEPDPLTADDALVALARDYTTTDRIMQSLPGPYDPRITSTRLIPRLIDTCIAKKNYHLFQCLCEQSYIRHSQYLDGIHRAIYDCDHETLVFLFRKMGMVKYERYLVMAVDSEFAFETLLRLDFPVTNWTLLALVDAGRPRLMRAVFATHPRCELSEDVYVRSKSMPAVMHQILLHWRRLRVLARAHVQAAWHVGRAHQYVPLMRFAYRNMNWNK